MEDLKLWENPEVPTENNEPVEEEINIEDLEAAGAPVRRIKKEKLEATEGYEFNIFNNAWGANSNEFYCEICKASMNSEDILFTHYRGKRHKRKVEALRYKNPIKIEEIEDISVKYIKIGGNPMFVKTEQLCQEPIIQSYVDKFFDSPVVGLGFVTEIQMLDEDEDPVYFCNLCPAECQSVTIINHCIGFKHRLAYIRLCDPDFYDDIVNSKGSKSSLTRRVENQASFYERKDGRGFIIVEKQLPEYDEGREDQFMNRVVPQFPPSSMPNILNKVKNLENSKAQQLLMLLASEMSMRSTLIELEYNNLQKVMADYHEVYFKSVVDYFEDKGDNAALLDDLRNQRYASALRRVFGMDVSQRGVLAKNVLLQLISEGKLGPNAPLKK